MDFSKIAAQAAAVNNQADLAKAGGGERETPKPGPARARLTGYIEVGKHLHTFKPGSEPKLTEFVYLGFEVTGPNHPVRVAEDGTRYPIIMWQRTNIAKGPKANFPKLFARMNYKGTAAHFTQLLGQAFKVEITNRKAGDKTYADVNLDSIQAPRYEVSDENGPTGVFKDLVIEPQITTTKCFVWDLATEFPAMWNSIFVEGEYEERKNEAGEVTHAAKSKNRWQNLIREAVNFPGSPAATLVAAGGDVSGLPTASEMAEAAEVPTGDDRPVAGPSDALAGIA